MIDIQKYEKILITGADGMLGRAFVQQLEKYVPSSRLYAYNRKELDVTDLAKIIAVSEYFFGEYTLIIHCAGLVSVELCEENKELAYDTIVNGTKNIIHLAKLTKSKIIYPQSFLIYDGIENPIVGSTEPNPQTYYASLKLIAEKEVVNHSSENLIVRMAGFFGGENKDKNFVGKIIPNIFKALSDGDMVFEVGDRVWQPTYTSDLALNTILLCAKNKSGVYLMSSIGEASFWDVACEISKNLGWTDLIDIKRISSDNFSLNEPGKRPLKAIFKNDRLDFEKINIQRGWKESLKEYLSSPYFDPFRK